MYLTRFRINTARSGARTLLSSPQKMHAAVMSSFPELLPTASGPRVLWRVDHNATAEVQLYVVGPARPDLTHLVEQAGWPAAAATGTTAGWQTYAYTPFLERLDKGTRWNFRLTANPVHHARVKDGEPTKRTAHVTARHQMQWLLQRQEAGGFRIVAKPEERRHTEHGDEHQLAVHGQRNLAFSKRGADGRVTLTAVTFDGRLEVTDPDALRGVLTGGLGKAKAYGCGLMTLAPIG